MRVSFDDLRNRIERVLLGLGMTPERAALSARLTAETDRDGVRTHGLARLPRFCEMVALGRIDVHAQPACEQAMGAIERWSAHRGPGNLAAHAAMARAMQLASTHGMGCVALRESSHWMRAGSYGWQAAEAGFAAMCWTNTLPNLPPWGAQSPALGNNPLVIAVPRAEGAIVLDMAMSQFSYGALASYRSRNEPLPVPGGYDEHGTLTTDAAAIERTQRALPIGFWKGAGLSFVLDVLAAMLAGGNATHDFSADPLAEVGQSQVFLAFAPSADQHAAAQQMLNEAVAALHAAEPIEPGRPARYPGEATLRTRAESLREGVPVDEALWQWLIERSA
jgi:3-dehydro-L-gulonate 2-dehydrogenase